jgi:hypothetical protein
MLLSITYFYDTIYYKLIILKHKEKAMTATDDHLTRAMAAWFRGRKAGTVPQYPQRERSMVVTAHGLDYVVLGNGCQVLGVYRIRPNGALKLLRRWPRDVETAAGWSREETHHAPL